MFAQVRGTLSSKRVGWLGRRNRAVKARQGVKTEDSACHGPGSGASLQPLQVLAPQPGQARPAWKLKNAPTPFHGRQLWTSNLAFGPTHPSARAGVNSRALMGHGVVDRGPSAGALCSILRTSTVGRPPGLCMGRPHDLNQSVSCELRTLHLRFGPTHPSARAGVNSRCGQQSTVGRPEGL